MARITTPDQNLSAALADLPARPRVHELAKRAGRSSREVIAALAERGAPVGSASSAVDAVTATALLTEWLSGAGAAVTDEPVAAVDTLAQPDLAAGVTEPTQASAASTRRRRGRAVAAGPAARSGWASGAAEDPTAAADPEDPTTAADPADSAGLLFLAPEPKSRAGSGTRSRRGAKRTDPTGSAEQTEPTESAERSEQPGPAATTAEAAGSVGESADPSSVDDVDATEVDPADGGESDSGGRRRRRRGRRGRSRSGGEQDDSTDEQQAPEGTTEPDPAGAPPSDSTGPTDGEQDSPGSPDDPAADSDSDDDTEADAGGATRRRRRRRRRAGGDETSEDTEARGGRGGSGDSADIPTVVHVRESRPSTAATGEVQGLRGSTRLEAKRQRRRDSRDTRKRPQILSEAEFLARRESVDRVMAVRQRGPLAQVALLEDDVLVEHFVSQAGSQSLMGAIFLGRVQNVLPSMEAAFLDIGRGRNGVLYAGEVNWDAAGLAGKARRIETALRPGDAVLVQVSKDPVGQKGARLTTQISLPGRFLVYVPGGGATGISRKLPDTERKRLKSILDRIVPDDAGVIIRTAAEGAPEEELILDVQRLQAQWEEISQAAANVSSAPVQLSSEPDTLIKVIRDLFNSDISRLVIDGEETFEAVTGYLAGVAPELADRVSRYDGDRDVFASYRIDEQIAKALERKVHLPSGGSLVIDRTEAMTVVDVNTGKFTGSGGNLEETVTRNNLEAAEEIVRQLRLRDIGGIIVVDFIDMVLESNRELVTRRLTECLGRDRTRHQVAEVTSLGLVQMTRKKLGTGLVEAFSEPCPQCGGRGIVLHDMPVDNGAPDENTDDDRRSGRGRRSRAKAEPTEQIEVRRVVTSAVRPPDPRGPRPPARSDGPASSDGSVEQSVPAGSAPPTGPPIDGAGTTASIPSSGAAPDPDRTVRVEQSQNAGTRRRDLSGGDVDPTSGTAEIGRLQGETKVAGEASAAVTAVLAALDARVAAGAEQLDPDQVSDRSAGVAEPAQPAPRRRGRRSAGRPAGAPTSAAPTSAAPISGDPMESAAADGSVIPAAGPADSDNSVDSARPADSDNFVNSANRADPVDPAAAVAADGPADPPASEPPPRPRRRRAASRPAGPAAAPVT